MNKKFLLKTDNSIKLEKNGSKVLKLHYVFFSHFSELQDNRRICFILKNTRSKCRKTYSLITTPSFYPFFLNFITDRSNTSRFYLTSSIRTFSISCTYFSRKGPSKGPSFEKIKNFAPTRFGYFETSRIRW